ncbi:MAG: EAL domain-containing protein, partial [Myxococcota bacterium]
PDTDQGGTLEERLQAHALPRAAEEQQDGRGEWALVSRHQTSSGRMVSTWTDISQRKRYEAQLEQLALYDSLTGLANRERFEAVLAQTLRDGQPGAVMMFDLDRFKLINDTWGHPIGDALLRKVGERLRDLLPETDLLARFGGDEFILLHGSGDVASSRQTAEAIIDTLSQRFLVEERSLSVGVSAGIVLTTSEPERTPEELLRCADLALYEAKARGGDQFVFYSAELDASAAEVLRLSMELRGAIDDGQLELFYQPIVCGKQLSHLEALLRWRHPELGLLTPNRFLTNKLGSGQMRAISREVITQACAAMARWDDLGWAPISVAVNLSAVEFSDPQLTNLIVDQLQRNGLPGNRLKLELTESTVMDISPDLLARMEGLQKLDVEIALDDFGTGYSSLAWLQRLPIRTLKIDRAFICGLPEDQSSAAIVNAILSMSRRMGLKVIAEGVETPEQRERLVGAGCDTLQGWLFSRPMFEDQLLQWLEENPQLFTQTARSA